MRIKFRRMLAVVLALSMLVLPAAGAEVTLTERIAGAAAYLYQAVPQPELGDTGGEWTVLALARSGQLDPEQPYAREYLTRLEASVSARQGVLHPRKYTEYSRLALTLTALGTDPAHFGGYDLLAPLADFRAVTWQGTNGPAWALLALDSGGYAIPKAPEGTIQATRQMYVDELLSRQLPNGAWSLTENGKDGGDADVTGMALQALAAYREQGEAADAIEAGLAYLSGVQDADGGFSSRGERNLESTAQAVVALCTLGIDLGEDPRFQKDGHSPVDALLGYQLANGGFVHTPGGEADLVATEQGLYAMAALQRLYSGQTSLYDMSDVTNRANAGSAAPLSALVRLQAIQMACVLIQLL